jgi:anti-sigma B factor antagonist
VIEVRCRSDAHATVLELVGDVCLSTVPTVRAAIAASLADRPERLVIDLTEVTLFGAAALNLLIETARITTASACELTITGAHGLTEYVINLTGLETLLTPEVERAS